MKVAVVHEWLVDWAGSERVLEQILHCFPDADLFTLVDFLPENIRQRIQNKRATTSFLQRMPFSKKHLALYLPLMPFAVEQFDLSKYDLVISSSHSVAKGVITGPDQIHVAYTYSPMRYAWDLQHEYLRGKDGRGLRGLLLRWVLHYLRLWDSRTPNGVDAFIADSEFIARRIFKTYRRSADVIYPPVELAYFQEQEQKEDFYLCAGRVVQYKRVDLVVQAFAQLPNHKLVVLGDGPELASIKRTSSANVQFLGYQPDEVIREYMQRAKGLIFAAKEDFGIVPVEAQACGTPVIAFGEGGACETVRPLGAAKPTGILFPNQSSGDIVAAIAQFEANASAFRSEYCRENAESFSSDKFRQQLRDLINRQLQTSRSNRTSRLVKPTTRSQL
jgi:glycosyltransferase involved in cell wall biosynthesis